MRRRRVVWLIVFLVALIAATMLPSFYRFVVTRALIFAVFAMAYDLVKGYGGLISLGHAALFGIGGYVLAMAITNFGVVGWGSVAIALLAGGILGAVIAGLTARSSGVYFLLLTLVIGEAMFVLANSWVSVTGGETGISQFSRGHVWVGLADDKAFLIACGVVATAVFTGLRAVVNSPWGLGLRGFRDSPARMEALGWAPFAIRMQVFALSGTISALAGALQAIHLEFIGPNSLSVLTSANVAVVTILGGPGTLIGPAIAAGIFVFANEVISSYTGHWLLILGLAYIAIMVIAPNGIAWEIKRRTREKSSVERSESPAP